MEDLFIRLKNSEGISISVQIQRLYKEDFTEILLTIDFRHTIQRFVKSQRIAVLRGRLKLSRLLTFQFRNAIL